MLDNIVGRPVHVNANWEQKEADNHGKMEPRPRATFVMAQISAQISHIYPDFDACVDVMEWILKRWAMSRSSWIFDGSGLRYADIFSLFHNFTWRRIREEWERINFATTAVSIHRNSPMRIRRKS